MEGSVKFKKNSIYAWLMVLVIYIASFTAPMTQFKIPPAAGMLIPEFNMDPTTFGWLMGAIAIIGLVLAFPAAFIVRRLGLKGACLLSIAFLGIGNLSGALWPNLTVLFAGRLLEGVGIGLIGVSAPAAISVWFDADKRGAPMSIWGTWVPVATVLMFNAGPAIAQAFGWRTLWWGSFILCAIAFVIFLVFFKLPNVEADEEINITASFSECLKVLKNKNIWMLGIAFLCWNFIVLGVINTFYNQYLGEVWGMDQQASSSITSILTAIGLVSMLFLGFLLDKWKRRKPFVIVGFVLVLIGSFFAFRDPGNLAVLITFIAVTGIGIALLGTASRPIAPEVMPATALGVTMGMSILQFFQYLSTAAGSPLFGALLQGFGWQLAGYMAIIPAVAIGLVAALVLRSR